MQITQTRSAGDYRILARLGEGGMAQAYLALRTRAYGFRKLFVMKQLRPELSSNPTYVEMFLDEARLAALLNHPNVVQTHEVGQVGADHFICMEYVEGQSLSRVLARVTRRRFPLDAHVLIISELLAGLHYAHELVDLEGNPLSVVHRDVSPGNVLVTYDGGVKLLDFGVAKTEAAIHHTRPGALKGKPAYMAPEQLLGSRVDRRTDVFAVGVMLWEALAGRRLASPAEADAAILHNRATGSWDALADAAPDAPPALVEICDRAMAVNPDDRYQDAAAFRVALSSCSLIQAVSDVRESLARTVSHAFASQRTELASRVAQFAESEDPPWTQQAVPRKSRGRPGSIPRPHPHTP